MKKLLLDCDPGIDDALALALAAGSPEIDLVGITTVGGNVSLDLTTANALSLREFYRLGDVPVTPGSAGALLGAGVRADSIHGATGLGGVTLPAPTRGVADGHAVDYIIETLRSAPGEITLVAVGPLSNIALAVRREPRIVEWARDFVIMGGSYTRGNHTPAAEFNIKADPAAASIVFDAGWEVTMVGLDVTLTAVVTESILDQMRSLGRLADLVVPISQFYGVVKADGGPAIHDAVAVAHVIDPTLLTLVPAVVNVETAGTYTAGMTVTDFKVDGRVPNAAVAVDLDVDRFWKLMLESYERLAARIA
ncbi:MULTISPECIES: nucleoside hydrolase [Nonomuraea]|uniref:Nucleoside hydrolase n=1 Tax=Nonomuraea mangrovi TaxID=2316207 RepID=A0ABW4T448_9ACTN